MKIEIERIPCVYCGEPIPTEWSMNDDGTTNGMLRGNGFALLGDHVAHDACFERSWEEYEKGLKNAE